MKRSAFTLVELLVVMVIIAILAGMSLAALAAAAEEGKRQRARSQIAKIDQLITEKYNSYRFRQVPIRIPAGTRPDDAARWRLYALRELMRMEMPDRLTDILDDPVPYPSANPPRPYLYLNSIPSLTRAYRRRITPDAASTLSYDQAEMLYLILSEMRDGDRSALSFFMASEIGDVDGDGMYEILDPWGMPIMWLRWAPGFSRVTNNEMDPQNQLAAPWPQIDVAVSSLHVPSGNIAPDPFDPLKVDPRWSITTPGTLRPFLLRPLIFSAGPSKAYDIYVDVGAPDPPYRVRTTTPHNDPYGFVVDPTGNKWMGMPVDANNDGVLQHGDNITNHGLELEGE